LKHFIQNPYWEHVFVFKESALPHLRFLPDLSRFAAGLQTDWFLPKLYNQFASCRVMVYDACMKTFGIGVEPDCVRKNLAGKNTQVDPGVLRRCGRARPHGPFLRK
jgi:hypothetical protein